MASTFDGAAVRIYLDGAEIGVTATSYNPSRTSVLRIAMGGTDGGASYSFAGTIDEVLVYDRALTAAEVAALHAR